MRKAKVGVAADLAAPGTRDDASIDARGALRDLNLHFLELLVASSGCGACAGLPGDVVERLAALSESQRVAAARCPYALFDARLDDELHWRAAVEAAGAWRIADAPRPETPPSTAASAARAASVPDGTTRFMQLVIFYAWSVAASAHPAQRALLGLSDATAALLRDTPLHRLPAVAAREAAHLSARWSGRRGFWLALIGAAGDADAAALRHVQLHGLQLAAAARLR